MATCVSIPISISADDSLPKTIIRDIIGTFFVNEWRNVDPETLTVTNNTGYANRNMVVERPRQESETSSEPFKLFFKIHGALDGEIAVFKHLVPDKQEEATLCYDYGRSGLGAQVYGFFQTQDGSFGRIDEFLDARNLEPSDVEDEIIRADVAKGHAAFHAMSTTLRKNSVGAYYDAIISELARYHNMEKLKVLAKEGGVHMDNLVEYDFTSRLRRVVDKVDAIGGKKGWCIHDVQFMNVMVKSNPQQGESKVVLIDFEFVFQNYRAFDIGGHFMQKLFKWFDEENKIADCRPYTEEEKRHFCEEYAKQWNVSTGDSDTGEQVFMESELGYMLAITFDIHNMLNFMDEEDDKDPLNMLGLNKLFEEFDKQYKKLGLDK